MGAGSYLATVDACLEIPEPARTEALAEVERLVAGATMPAGGAATVDFTRSPGGTLASPRTVAARLTLGYWNRPRRRSPIRRLVEAFAGAGSGPRQDFASSLALIVCSLVAGLTAAVHAPEVSLPGLGQWLLVAAVSLFGVVKLRRAIFWFVARVTLVELRRIGFVLWGAMTGAGLVLVLGRQLGLLGLKGAPLASLVYPLVLLPGLGGGLRRSGRCSRDRVEHHPDYPAAYVLTFLGFMAGELAALLPLLAGWRGLSLALADGLLAALLSLTAILLARFGTPDFIGSSLMFLTCTPILTATWGLVLCVAREPAAGFTMLVLGLGTHVIMLKLRPRLGVTEPFWTRK